MAVGFEHTTLLGRPCTAVYVRRLGGRPVRPENAKYVVVNFEDDEGGEMILVRTPEKKPKLGRRLSASSVE
jgi:hypothetical protein